MKSFLIIAIVFLFAVNISTAQTWKELGPIQFPTNNSGQINGQGRVTQIQFHPTLANILYATSASGGLYKSVDTGHNWTLLGTDQLPVMNLSSICIDYTNDQILYLASGDPNYYYPDLGIFKSIDGGQTWTSSSNGLSNELAVDILMDPNNNQNIVIATNNGIWRSSNAGANWVNVLNGGAFTHMVRVPNSNTLLAVTAGTFYRSTNFGISWSPVVSTTFTQANADGMRICVNHVQPQIVYVLSNGNNGVVYKSTDTGQTFSQIYSSTTQCLVCYDDQPSSPGQGNYDFAACADPLDPNHLYVAAHCLWESNDGGLSWQQKTEWWKELHTDHHQLLFNPYNNAQLWNANDGGVWLREGLNDSLWQPMSDGITAMEIYFAANSPKVRKQVSAGTQDNGEVFYNNNGWFTNRGGDWTSRMEYDYNNENYVYYLEDGERRPFNPTAGSSTYNSPFTPNNNSRIAFSSFNKNWSILAKDSLWLCKDLSTGSPSWTLMHPTTLAIRDLVFSSADSNTAYAISNTKIYRINQLSSTPQITALNVPYTTGTRASIATVKADTNLIYISCNARMYRSADYGITWTNITYNLPATNIVKIYHDDFSSNETVYVCSGNRFYTKTINDTVWTDISANLPKIANVRDFMLFNDSTVASKLRVAYFGRGVWEYLLHPNYPPVADFSVEQSVICSGDSVQFNNLSVEDNLTYQWSFNGGVPASSSLKNPKVAFPNPGVYNVSLFVSNANGSDTKTINSCITVLSNAPAVDDVPGKALSVNGTASSYADAGSLNITTNHATIMCWIKPQGPQNDWGGIVFARGASASGISIKSNNEIRYHWNDNGWGFSSGLIVPDNQWSHLALVVSPNKVTIYVNGMPSDDINNPALASFADHLVFGADLTSASRRFKGLIDEVCFYNRSLSQNEIREQMHLVKNNAIPTDSLIGYWQMNELTSSNTILNKANCANQAKLLPACSLSTSTGPFGKGSSERMSVNSAIAVVTNLGDMALDFSQATTLPNDEICVTHLQVAPDEMPANVNSAGNYWIVDNYGNNTNLSTISPFTLYKAGTLNGLAGDYQLYQRPSNADGSTWSASLCSASAMQSGANGSLTFTGATNINTLGQFVVTGPYVGLGIADQATSQLVTIYPVPAKQLLYFDCKSNQPYELSILDIKGNVVYYNPSVKGLQSIDCSYWSNGIYNYYVSLEGKQQHGKIEIMH